MRRMPNFAQRVKMGDVQLIDMMIKDGLWDHFNGYHMGTTAENVAAKWQITREEQDSFAAASQNKAEAAQKAGKFKDEIVPVTISGRKGDSVVDMDSHPRHGTTIEALAKLRPAFAKDGSVTAGNASGINDGAAIAVLMSGDMAARRGITPLARIVSFATRGVDPAIMGSGPIPASRAALEKAGWAASDLDLVEANEAFAAQACAVTRSWLGSGNRKCQRRLSPGTRSVRLAVVCLSHCCMRCRSGTQRRVWQPCVLAAAWALRFASSGIEYA